MAQAATVEIDAQCRQWREECGLFDRSGRGKLLVTGPDAAEYLQGQLTNDVDALEPGQGCYAALLDRKGHMQADMRVLRLSPEEVWIDTEPEAIEAARRHLAMYKIGREVEVDDVGAERAILSLAGPRSAAIAGSPPPATSSRAPTAPPAAPAPPTSPPPAARRAARAGASAPRAGPGTGST